MKQSSLSLVTGVLNRAEWFKFLGMFFNLDAVATNMFNNINESYYDTKASIEVAAEPPLMIFSDYYDYSDESAYEVSLAAYKVQYTQVSCPCIPLLNFSCCSCDHFAIGIHAIITQHLRGSSECHPSCVEYQDARLFPTQGSR